MKRISLILLVTAVVLLIDRQTEAQRRVPHYQRTPAISPYVNLFRADNGGLNSFSGNYQPSQRLRQFVADTNSEFYYQQRATSAESIRLAQEIAAATEGDPMLAQQGLILRPTTTAGSTPRVAGTFLQHSRYFPGSATAGSGGANFAGRGSRRAPIARGGVGVGGYGSFNSGGLGTGMGTGIGIGGMGR